MVTSTRSNQQDQSTFQQAISVGLIGSQQTWAGKLVGIHMKVGRDILEVGREWEWGGRSDRNILCGGLNENDLHRA